MTPETSAAPEWWPCCACCDQGVTEDDQDRCYFNGQRDRHTGPCDECEKPCECCGDVHPKGATA